MTYQCLQGSIDRQITEIVYHSEKACDGSVFVCITGADADGHDYATQAAAKGAAAVICEKSLSMPEEVTVIKVDDSRYAMAHMAATFYGNPSANLQVIGVTGTKGKTTTCYMIRQLLEAGKIKTGLMSTICVDTGETCVASEHTTPEAPEVQRYLRAMADCGCQAAVIEVSSQALKLHRVEGVDFDFGVFTNIEEDHIGPGEHQSFSEYARCKGKLFRMCRIGIINGDDPRKDLVLAGHTCRIFTYGFGAGNDLSGSRFRCRSREGKLGVEFQVKGDYNINLISEIPGKFTGSNIMAALSAGSFLGISEEVAENALRRVHVPGRQELFTSPAGGLIAVDYAHNGMALRCLLESMRAYGPKKLICVFGCGGQRDPRRRQRMGCAAAMYADEIIITSDNPRGEPPEKIIAEIAAEIENYGTPFYILADRDKAIDFAVRGCGKGEIAVIAGKGHETCQIIGSRKIHFDDREAVLASIEKVKDEQHNHWTN